MDHHPWVERPEDELRSSNMIEAIKPFLLGQVSEDADVFGLQKIDSEHLIKMRSPVDLENATVEKEKLRRIGCRLVHF